MGHVEMTSKLIAAGAKMNAQTWEGKTPLHVAAAYAQYEICSIFLHSGADTEALDNEYRTPLMDICRSNHGPGIDLEAFYDLFAGCGADVTARDVAGNTLLHLFASRQFFVLERDLRVLDKMLAAGIDINARNVEQMTGLHLHLQGSGRLGVTRFMLDRRANPNLQDDEGNTALHMVWKELEIKALLAAGANPFIRNKQGESPWTRVKKYTSRSPDSVWVRTARLFKDHARNIQQKKRSERFQGRLRG
jgi:ankyrin repeat protein